jgi:manganese efflux pump family protein
VISGSVKILVVAVSLALDVFAVSIGVGVRDVTTAMKWRIGVAFASAEVIMNVIGAGIGAVAGRLIGDAAGYLGFAALVGLGGYMIFESLHRAHDREPMDLSKGWGLFIASLSISLDSLGIGFSILYIGVPIGVALGVIAVVSVLATWLGLTLGKRLGTIAEEGAELLGGILLFLTGAAFIAFKALHIG